MPFLSPLNKLANTIFGTGIYGNKVSQTIAEANTYQISYTVMSIGPAIYWVGWAGFIFLLWYYYREKLRRDYLFFIVLFIIDLWLTSTAGRFLNDMTPLIALFAGFVTWYFVDRVNYKQMVRNIKSAGGGLHGLRKGIKFMHIFGVILIAFVIILPNAYVAFDAALPNKSYFLEDDEGELILDDNGNPQTRSYKTDYFGNGTQGAFGLSLYKERYWADAFDWLSQQDPEISKSVDRPAIISWWDYGFYEVALGKHPTVADNFQDGIPPASNFHTAVSEKEAVAVWIVRLLEGNLRQNDGVLSDNVKQILEEHLGLENSEKLIDWVENTRNSKTSSYGDWISENFNQYISPEINRDLMKVGAQWAENAIYHDIVKLVNNGTFEGEIGLTEEQVTWLYHDLQEATGYSIRYYGVEGYDRQIFNIFAFLADKSLVLLVSDETGVLMGAPSDDFVDVMYSGYKLRPEGGIESEINSEPFLNYLDLPKSEKKYIAITGSSYDYKEAYFDTMFYRTFIGQDYVENTQTGKKTHASFQVPCLDMKHFYPEFISDINEYPNPYSQGQSAVVISKYYEGALLNGTIFFDGEPLPSNATISIVKNLTYTENFTIPIYHDSQKIVGNDINYTGEFDLVAGADSYISVIRNEELRYYDKLITPYVIKNIYFNGSKDENLMPITDDDAMRKTGSNFMRNIEINIEPGTATGYIYEDIDDTGEYNISSSDKAVDGAEVRLFEINEFNRDGLMQDNPALIANNEKTPFINSSDTDENGYYEISGLFPGYYAIQVYLGDYIINNEIIAIAEGENIYNLSKPKSSDLEGYVYYDTNDNNEYNPDVDVTLTDADVELNYVTGQGTSKLEGSTTTDSEGKYSFSSLTPGYYTIKASTSDYQATTTNFEIGENTTRIYNVSTELIPINVTGYAKYSGQGVKGAGVSFEVDDADETNTAKAETATTDENGYYSIQLQPGKYKINVMKPDEADYTVMVYSLYNETLELTKGQGSTTKDFALTKETVTVSGTALFNGVGIENVTIDFNTNTEVFDNNAKFKRATSDSNGDFEVELKTGSYLIVAESEKFNESGVDYYYTYTEALNLTSSDILLGRPFDIILKKQVYTS